MLIIPMDPFASCQGLLSCYGHLTFMGMLLLVYLSSLVNANWPFSIHSLAVIPVYVFVLIIEQQTDPLGSQAGLLLCFMLSCVVFVVLAVPVPGWW